MSSEATSVTHSHRPHPGAALVSTIGGPARLRIVAMLAAVLALSSADTATIGAIAAPLESGLHIDNTAVGLLVTLSTGIGALATLPMGAVADRFNRTRTLYIAVLIWSVVMVVNGLSVDYTMLLISRLGLGVVMAVGGPVIASLTGDWFPVTERGRIYGFVLSGELVGGGIGFLVCGTVADVLSWRWAFWVLAILGFGLSWFVGRAPEPARGGASRLSVGATSFTAISRRHNPPPRRQDDGPVEVDLSDPLVVALRENQVEPYDDHVPAEPNASFWLTVRTVLSLRTNVLLILASALGYFFFTGVETFGVLLLQERFSLGETAASALLVLVGAGAVIGALLGGRIADRLLRDGHVAARPVVAGIAFVVCVAFFVPGLLTPALLITAPLVALGALGLGATNPPLDAARLDLVDERMWGRAEALRTVLRTIFEALAPLAFGLLSTSFGERTSGLANPTSTGSSHGTGLDHTFLVMLAPVLLAGILLLVWARRTYPRDVATVIHEELLEARGTGDGPAVRG